MAGPFQIALAVADAANFARAVFFNQRNIGGLIADVTVEERHRDSLTVTQNPVEQGAAVTDHAFKQPAMLTVRAGFSNSSLAALGSALASPIAALTANSSYVQDMYNAFLAMQANRQPIQVNTGKRIYQNMLIESLETFTDQAWENAMLLTVNLKQIIIVQTQVVSVPSSQVMKAPGITGATQQLGDQSLQPGSAANTSALPN